VTRSSLGMAAVLRVTDPRSAQGRFMERVRTVPDAPRPV
jgi:hypothetical protein